uniref:RNA helicase n=1 Tax=Rhabditophanes sp. KR3021 TaxID=114890 RepID=A0AC35UC22_9BILA
MNGNDVDGAVEEAQEKPISSIKVCGKTYERKSALKGLNEILMKQGKKNADFAINVKLHKESLEFTASTTVQITINGPSYRATYTGEDRDLVSNECAFFILQQVASGVERNIKLSNNLVKREVPKKRDEVVNLKQKFFILGQEVTYENAKSLLNSIMGKEGMPAVQYGITKLADGPPFGYEASVDIKLASSGTIYKKSMVCRNIGTATTECAFEVLRDISANNEYLSLDNKRRLKIGLTKTPITIFENEELSQDLEAFYKWVGVELPPIDVTSTENQVISPPIQHYLSQSDKSKSTREMLDWMPPTENFSCWRNGTIPSGSFFAMKSLGQISYYLQRIEARKKSNLKVESVRERLPVFNQKNEIIDACESNQVVLIKSNTGSGKSTQVAQFLLKHYLNLNKGAEFNAIITQPRRLSAISLAKRVAMERYEKIGDSVGYCIRFDKVDPRPFGSLIFATVGTILKKMNTGFRGVSHIIVDEVHERSLDTDFLLIILKRMLSKFRGLKVILMSATVNTTLFEKYFRGIRVIDLETKAYRVDILYLDAFIQSSQFIPSNCQMPPQYEEEAQKWSFDNCDKSNGQISPIATHIVDQIESSEEFPYQLISFLVRDSVRQMGSQEHGSILIFVPGWYEIMTCIETLAQMEREAPDNVYKYWVLPLHSNLTTQEQSQVFKPPPEGHVKVIISTNIAESSITVEDVLYVIDSCKQKMKMKHHNSSASIFRVAWASKDCMEQRKGRAGRCRPGYCYRLCSTKMWGLLQQQSEAEIITAPLHGSILQLKALGLGDSASFLGSSMEPPDRENVWEAEKYLQNLYALDANKELTPIGRKIERLPFSPDTSKSIITAALFGLVNPMAIIAANGSSPSSLFNNSADLEVVKTIVKSFCGDFISDHILAVAAINCKESAGDIQFKHSTEDLNAVINFVSVEYLRRVRDQIVDILEKEFPNFNIREAENVDNKVHCINSHVILSLLVKSYYPNICFQTKKRMFYDMDGFKMLSHKNSIISMQENCHEERSPFAIYTEKIITSFAMFKECSVVSPVQILLFGSDCVSWNGGSTIRLDDCYTLGVDVKLAQMILYIRLVIDELLNSMCLNGGLTPKEQDMLKYVRNLIERISTLSYKINNITVNLPEMRDITKVNFESIGGVTNLLLRKNE